MTATPWAGLLRTPSATVRLVHAGADLGRFERIPDLGDVRERVRARTSCGARSGSGSPTCRVRSRSEIRRSGLAGWRA
ncbi:hypothetical protein [Pseudonocardia endophytica]|uniref:hypothetical protein n=1 Tax=Pseudonocardia endophytica TaxID=401976 RepID=UPI001404BBFD|nr:hypothetical protein [Pseudonocardia endophytica]